MVEYSVLARISLDSNYGNYGNYNPHFSSEIRKNNAHLLLFKKHFVRSPVPQVHVNTSKYTPIFYPVMNISYIKCDSCFSRVTA